MHPPTASSLLEKASDDFTAGGEAMREQMLRHLRADMAEEAQARRTQPDKTASDIRMSNYEEYYRRLIHLPQVNKGDNDGT